MRRGIAVCLVLSISAAPLAFSDDDLFVPAPGAKEVSLSLTEGTWMSVDVSPNGQTLVFDLLNDIYVLPATGGEAMAIHSGPQVQRSPSFSPDGKSIVYISDSSGADNVWVSDADGANARQITHEKTALITDPAWAADGGSIIAVKMHPSIVQMRSTEIHRFALDGSKDEIIVPAPESGKDVEEPRASPDGDHVLYTERVAGDHYVYVNTGQSNFVVKQGNLDEGWSRELIGGFGGTTSPQISPDGKHVAFIRRVKAETVVFRYDMDTHIQTPVFAGLSRDLQADYIAQEHYYPAYDWFPDNKHIAIWSQGALIKVNMETGETTPIPFHVNAKHTINPSIRAKLDVNRDNVNVRTIRQWTPAPKGERVIFHAIGSLWLLDGAGATVPKRLTTFTGTEFEPSWSDDGSMLAYVAWDDGIGSRLIVRDMASGSERVAVTSRSVIRNPVISHHGKIIAYRIMEADTSMGGPMDPDGIYLVNADGSNAHFLAPGVDIAGFSPDNTRLILFGVPDYYGQKASVLQSANLDGSSVKDIGYAPTADTNTLALSPDLNWIAFREYNIPYVMPFAEGADPLTITAQNNPSARRLHGDGGYELAWSKDSQHLYFVLGADVFATAPGDTGLAQLDRSISLNAPTDRPVGSVAFTGGRVIPIIGAVIEKGTVLVTGDKIAAVGPDGSIDIPAHAKRIDISGKTIMPGFFDAHGHIDCCFGKDVMPVKQPTRYSALAYGVTTNFDPYANDLISYESAEMTMAGLNVGPRWLTSGQVIYGRAGRPDTTFNPITSLDDARAILRRRQAQGQSILKSYKLTTRDQRLWLLKAAREGGYNVDLEGAGHFYDNVTALLDGYTNLEHNLPVATYYDDLLQLFAAADVSNTPTLIVTFGELFGENYIYQTSEPWKEQKARTFIPDVNNAYNPIATSNLRSSDAPLQTRAMSAIHYAEELYDIGFRSVGKSIARLNEAGVTINVGSHGQAAGIAIHWEMQLLAQGGISNGDILKAATLNGAHTYGLDHQLGSIEAGKLADLIVLDRNPLDDIRNTNSVSLTMVNGRLYDANTMNEIGNYDRPRGAFFWETLPNNGIEWKAIWGHQQ